MKKLLIAILTVLSVTLFAVGCLSETESTSTTEPIATPQGFSLNAKGVLSWETVKDAKEYKVTVSGDTTSVDENKVDLLGVITSEGNYTISVKAVVGTRESDAGEFVLNAVKLGAPTKPYIEEDESTHAVKFVWQGDENTRSYLQCVNDGKWVTNSDAFYELTSSGEYEISVKAKAYGSGKILYLESDASEKSDKYTHLQGPVLRNESINVISWSSDTEFDCFNLWVDGVKVKENVVLDGGEYSLIDGESPAITKTGEYNLQIEAIKGDKSFFSNMLEQVGTSNINENELYSFDNRKANFTTIKNGVSVSNEQFHGESGYSLRLELSGSEQLNFVKYAQEGFANDIDYGKIKKASYWIYVPSIANYDGETFPASALPMWKWEKKGWTFIDDEGNETTNFRSAFFKASEDIPFDTWTKVEIDNLENIDSDRVFILSIPKLEGVNYVFYIDDIKYEELYEDVAVEGAEYVVEYNPAAVREGRWDGTNFTTIDLGAQNAGKTVYVTMDVCGTADAGAGANTIGFLSNGKPDADYVNYEHKYLNASYISSLAEWKTVTFEMTVGNEGKVYLTGTYSGKDVTRTPYKIFVKNVRAFNDSDIDGDAIAECGDNGIENDKYYQNIVGLTTNLAVGTVVEVGMDIFVTGEYNASSGIYWLDSVYSNDLWHDATKIVDDTTANAQKGKWYHVEFVATVRNFENAGIYSAVDTSAYGNAVYLVSRQKTAFAFHYKNVEMTELYKTMVSGGANTTNNGFYQSIAGLSTDVEVDTNVVVEMDVRVTGTYDAYSGIYLVDSVYSDNSANAKTNITSTIITGDEGWYHVAFVATVRNFTKLRYNAQYNEFNTSAYGNAVYLVSQNKSYYAIDYKNVEIAEIDGTKMPECGDNGNANDKYYQNVVGLSTGLSAGTAVEVEMDIFVTGEYNASSGIYWLDSVWSNNLWNNATKIVDGTTANAQKGKWYHVSFDATVRNFENAGIFAAVDTSAYGNAVYLVSRQKTANAFNYKNVTVNEIPSMTPGGNNGNGNDTYYQSITGLTTDLAVGTSVCVEMDVYVTGTFNAYSHVKAVDTVYSNNALNVGTEIVSSVTGENGWHRVTFVATVRNFTKLRYSAAYTEQDTSAYGNAVYLISMNKSENSFNYKNVSISEIYSMTPGGNNGNGNDTYYQSITGLTTDLEVGTTVTVEMDVMVTGTFNSYSHIYAVDTVYSNNALNAGNEITAIDTSDSGWQHITFTATVRNFTQLRYNAAYTEQDTSTYGNAVYLISMNKSANSFSFRNVTIKAA